MAKHFYEIGDTAYIKGDLSMSVEYVSPWMIKKKGKKVTIRTKKSSGRIPYYYLEGMEGSWTEEMLDPTNNTLHKKNEREKQKKKEELERLEGRLEGLFDGQGITRGRIYEGESALHRWDNSPYFFTGDRDRDRDRGMRRSMSFVSPPQPFSASIERPSSDLSFSLDYNVDWFRSGAVAEANTTVIIEEE